MRIVFLGTAEFGIPALESLVAGGHTIAGIVTTPPRPSGRGLKLTDSPIALYAQSHSLGPIFTPEKLRDADLVNSLKALRADLFVVVAYRILPFEIFEIPPFGTVNIHASLLPRYRGPAPIHRAIQMGEKITGVTVFRIDRGIDTGSIIVQKSTAIGSLETTPELYERLSAMGAEALVEAVQSMQNSAVVYIPQNDEQACGAPKLRKEESLIDWTQSAQSIDCCIRAFKPFPGTTTILDKKRLGIDVAIPVDMSSTGILPGTITALAKDHFDVACGVGTLRVVSVRPEGKKHMAAGEFLRGCRITEGTLLQ